MWIRSQDKETLAKADYFDLQELEDKEIAIGSFTPSGKFDYVGIYKTKERALKVLDEIQWHIENYDIKYQEAYISARVYEMPKE